MYLFIMIKKIFIINKLNFVLKKNEITGIDGISGSGKTTILNILSGLLSLNLEKYYK